MDVAQPDPGSATGDLAPMRTRFPPRFELMTVVPIATACITRGALRPTLAQSGPRGDLRWSCLGQLFLPRHNS